MIIQPTFEELVAIGGFDFDEAERDVVGIRGHGIAALYDEEGALKDLAAFRNLITNYGDEYYAERAAGIASPPAQVTGMQLGTGATAPNKATQAGLLIGALVANSLVAIDGGFPTSTNAQVTNTACRIQWKTTWNPGVATANGIQEVALVNQSTGTQTVAPASATIARAVLGTVVNKASGDTLAITWNNDLLGA
jgi:hypothetical protein